MKISTKLKILKFVKWVIGDEDPPVPILKVEDSKVHIVKIVEIMPAPLFYDIGYRDAVIYKGLIKQIGTMGAIAAKGEPFSDDFNTGEPHFKLTASVKIVMP